jgi:hypothetical protein
LKRTVLYDWICFLPKKNIGYTAVQPILFKPQKAEFVFLFNAVNVEKNIIRNKNGISTISTSCGQVLLTDVNLLSTGYPHSVDNVVMHKSLLSVKTQI